MKKADIINSMNFIKPIIVNGRTVEGLGAEHCAQMQAFPWIAVWQRNAPERVRLTTVFNVRDCEPIADASAEPEAKPAKK